MKGVVFQTSEMMITMKDPLRVVSGGVDVGKVFDGMSPEHRALYAKHTQGMKRVIKVSQKLAVPTDNVAAASRKASGCPWTKRLIRRASRSPS